MKKHSPSQNSGTKSTVTDVALLAGVSTATVSRVINGLDTVSGRTKNVVLKAISKLQFSPNPHAAQLARSGSGVPKRKPGKRLDLPSTGKVDD